MKRFLAWLKTPVDRRTVLETLGLTVLVMTVSVNWILGSGDANVGGDLTVGGQAALANQLSCPGCKSKCTVGDAGLCNAAAKFVGPSGGSGNTTSSVTPDCFCQDTGANAGKVPLSCPVLVDAGGPFCACSGGTALDTVTCSFQ